MMGEGVKVADASTWPENINLHGEALMEVRDQLISKESISLAKPLQQQKGLSPEVLQAIAQLTAMDPKAGQAMMMQCMKDIQSTAMEIEEDVAVTANLFLHSPSFPSLNNEEGISTISITPNQQATAASNAPFLLSFILDRSGSMNNCISQLIASVKSIIAMMKDGNMVQIVLFGDDAMPLIRPTVLDKPNRTHINNMLNFQSDRMTNLDAGIELANNLIFECGSIPLDTIISYVVLTDGHVNRGITAAKDIAQKFFIAYEGKKLNRPVMHVYGLGQDYDVAYCQMLAGLCDGTSDHISTDTLFDFEAMVAKIIKEAVSTVITDVKIIPGNNKFELPWFYKGDRKDVTEQGQRIIPLPNIPRSGLDFQIKWTFENVKGVSLAGKINGKDFSMPLMPQHDDAVVFLNYDLKSVREQLIKIADTKSRGHDSYLYDLERLKPMMTQLKTSYAAFFNGNQEIKSKCNELDSDFQELCKPAEKEESMKIQQKMNKNQQYQRDRRD
jgi:Mg-chelatase subunit ChlD